MATLVQQRRYGLDDLRLGGSQVLVKAELADSSTLSQLLATQGFGKSRSRSMQPFRKSDSSARLKLPGVLRTQDEELTELERRLTYLHGKQEAYDEYAAKPRAVRRPDSRLERANFHRQLDEALALTEAKVEAQQRIQVFDEMTLQKAQQRHFDWTKRVYEPIASAVNHAVDAQKEGIANTRRQAYNDFLKATSSRKGVFLDDSVTNYDPYAVSRASIRVPINVNGVDPTKTLLQKRRKEMSVMDPVGAQAVRRARVKDLLPAQQYTAAAMEATIHGHFEIQDSKPGGGNMAFAGRDTASSVHMDDFADPSSMTTRLSTSGGYTLLRVKELDAEFPVGKRMEGYPYRFQPSGTFLQHHSVAGVYGSEDGVFTDVSVVDNVRKDVTARRLQGMKLASTMGTMRAEWGIDNR